MKHLSKFISNTIAGLIILFLISNCGRENDSGSYSLLSDPISISMGDAHTCAVFASGSAQCWGYNRSNQLGNLAETDSLVPTNVTAFSGSASSIAALGTTTCAIVNEGAQCWGGGGPIGNGTSTGSKTAVQVTGLTSGVTALSNGQSFGCALVNGGVKCWGGNANGQLGNATLVSSTTPTDVSGHTSGVDNLSRGGGNHTCAVSSGSVKCWGRGAWGQLGNGREFQSSTPVSVTGSSSGVSSVAVGRWHSCALLTNGSVKCWGRNAFGQLGNDTLDSSLTPVAVTGMETGVTQLVGGGHHMCAIKDSELYCWGNNGDGQLGDGSNTNHATPTLVPGFTGVTLVAAGRAGTCAVKAGKLYCWGSNVFGQLGDGTTTNRNTPTGVYATAFTAKLLFPLNTIFNWVKLGWQILVHWSGFR